MTECWFTAVLFPNGLFTYYRHRQKVDAMAQERRQRKRGLRPLYRIHVRMKAAA